VNTSYKILLFLHILSIVVAFAPASVHPLLTRQYKGDSAGLQRFAGFAAQNGRRVYAPALILAGLFGILLIVDSDDAFAFDQTWISLAFVVWFAMNGVAHGMIIPNERKLGQGDAEAERKIDMGGMIITVLFLIQLYLMIWKPGL
jgi:uncharacterized membrane protein